MLRQFTWLANDVDNIAAPEAGIGACLPMKRGGWGAPGKRGDAGSGAESSRHDTASQPSRSPEMRRLAGNRRLGAAGHHAARHGPAATL